MEPEMPEQLSTHQNLVSEIERIKSVLLANPGKNIAETEFHNLPRAAVAMLLRPNLQVSDLELLFIKRNDRERDPWSGQIAFPGGHYVEKDQHILATAIREVLEEVGIDLRTCSMLGTLDEILPGNRAIRVTTYVAMCPENVGAKIDPNEVAESFWIPLSFFNNGKNAKSYTIERFGTKIVLPSYHYSDKYVIWGMTYRIIEDFLFKTKWPGKSSLP